MKSLPIDIEEFLDYLKDTYKCKPKIVMSDDLRSDLKRVIYESLSIPQTSPWSGIFSITMDTEEIGYHGSYKNKTAVIYDIRFSDPTFILDNTNSESIIEFKERYLELKGKIREIKNKCFPITILNDD